MQDNVEVTVPESWKYVSPTRQTPRLVDTFQMSSGIWSVNRGCSDGHGDGDGDGHSDEG